MQPQRSREDDVTDPKRLVADSHDHIAERHSEWAARVRAEERGRYTARVLAALPRDADVLELGCGAGGPTTQALAAHFRLTGVDISPRSIELGRHNVPEGQFICGDMTQIDLPASSFDAVVAFYSIIHVPREEQSALLRRVAQWLRPGGLFVATFGAADHAADYDADFLGAPMYWSAYDPVTTQRLVEAAGLGIELACVETAEEDGQPISFLWLEARRLDVVE
jgi:SAM-dependent methyltransferase